MMNWLPCKFEKAFAGLFVETTLQINPLQHLHNKLSFVKITPFSKMKTLILRGSFNFHIDLFRGMASWFTRCLYIDCTVKDPSFERLHLMESRWSSNCTNAILITSSFHLSRFSPTNALLKEILRGVELKTLATEMCFFLQMLYRDGYCSLRVEFLSHLSS